MSRGRKVGGTDPRFARAEARERAGDLGGALRLYGEAAAAAPGDPEALARHGAALAQAGRHPEAVRVLERALGLAPDHVPARFALGVALTRLGRLGEAERAFEQAVAADPDHAGAALNLGALRFRRRDYDGARAVLEPAARRHPEAAPLWASLGDALAKLGRYDAAADALERALAAAPDLAPARLQLGVVRTLQGRPEEAAGVFHEMLRADPNDVPARYNLGVVQVALGRLDEAAETYAEVLRADPAHEGAALNLGNLFRIRDRYDEALEVLAAAVARHPRSARLRAGLANVHKSLGRLAEAEAAYRAAVDLDPDDDAAWGNYLMCALYAPDHTPAEILDLHRAWGARCTTRVGAAARNRHPNDPDPDRPLKVGYLSPDLCGHAVAVFLEPVLEHHDRARVAAHCYASVKQPDATTERLRGLAAHWRDVIGMPDAEVAARVADDGIDLLVELAGHTGGSRLPVLAYRPAPVQATYLGYPATTGLAAVDWRLSDGWADPEGEDPPTVERIQRIAGGFCCYRPPDDAPDVRPLPALAAGHVTFGSLANTVKVNPRVIALWAEVLAAVPDSRLLLRRHAFREEAMRRRMRDAFAAHGIAPERVACESGHGTDAGDFQATYGRIDLGLDTFPYAGHTTTCEALWMGVPTLTLAGDAFVGRTGVSVMHMAGLPEFAVSDRPAFVDAARRFAFDPDALAALRAGLRVRMRASALCDGPGFTRRLEDAYRRMWRDWCASRAPGA